MKYYVSRKLKLVPNFSIKGGIPISQILSAQHNNQNKNNRTNRSFQELTTNHQKNNNAAHQHSCIPCSHCRRSRSCSWGRVWRWSPRRRKPSSTTISPTGYQPSSGSSPCDLKQPFPICNKYLLALPSQNYCSSGSPYCCEPNNQGGGTTCVLSTTQCNAVSICCNNAQNGDGTAVSAHFHFHLLSYFRTFNSVSIISKHQPPSEPVLWCHHKYRISHFTASSDNVVSHSDCNVVRNIGVVEYC